MGKRRYGGVCHLLVDQMGRVSQLRIVETEFRVTIYSQNL